MPAKKNSIKNKAEITTNIGIVAGEGELPKTVYDHCKSQGHNVKIAALKNYASEDMFKNNSDCEFFAIAKIGRIIDFFKRNNIKKIVLIGKVTRPNLLSLIPDWEGLKLIFKISLIYKKGDNSLFGKINQFIEDHGFELTGVHEIYEELLAEEGELGNLSPDKKQQKDIAFGIRVAKEIGKRDRGQAIIVKDEKVFAKEDMNGTNHMIKSFASGKEKPLGAILIKAKKPGQDERVDLPTIGVDTVKLCKESSLAGIVVEAGASLIVNKSEVKKAANKEGIFVTGVKAEN